MNYLNTQLLHYLQYIIIIQIIIIVIYYAITYKPEWFSYNVVHINLCLDVHNAIGTALYVNLYNE